MKKIALFLFAFFVALILFMFIFLYGLFGKYEYTQLSLDYYLFTSQELKDLSQHCEDSPRFVYWPGDNSPVTVKLYCTYDLALFDTYIKQQHFTPDQTLVDGRIRKDLFIKGEKSIEREISNNKVVVTTTYDDALPALQNGINIFGTWVTIF